MPPDARKTSRSPANPVFERDRIVSRVSGETFGSAATFGMAGTPSAPGQIPVEDLHAVLTVLRRARSG